MLRIFSEISYRTRKEQTQAVPQAYLAVQFDAVGLSLGVDCSKGGGAGHKH